MVQYGASNKVSSAVLLRYRPSHKVPGDDFAIFRSADKGRANQSLSGSRGFIETIPRGHGRLPVHRQVQELDSKESLALLSDMAGRGIDDRLARGCKAPYGSRNRARKSLRRLPHSDRTGPP